MAESKVYFTDFRTIAFGDSLPIKLKKLIRKAGIGQIDMDGKFVALRCTSESWQHQLSPPQLRQGGSRRSKGAGRQALPYRLQHYVPRQP